MRRNSRYLLRRLAKEMRRHPTRGERALWEALRGRRCHGLKIRRQVILGGFIVDFYCPALKVVIEVDGAAHDPERTKERDIGRDQALLSLGVHMIRLKDDPQLIPSARQLLAELSLRSPSPSYGEGDRG